MARICYETKTFQAATLELIYTAEDIIVEYAKQGFSLSLRQLYYQLVARAILPNKDSEYKRLGRIINDARIGGLIDWLSIVDRSRALKSVSHWEDPSQIIRGAASQYRIDKWATQPERLEVWIEKDALVGVIGGVCSRLDVPYFSCRGYPSVSAVWEASQRMLEHAGDDNPQSTTVLHLGDHDPSGIDMTRDIRDRLTLFMGTGLISVWRIALTMKQIEEVDPPPNPTKLTDSRAQDYIENYGYDSWELDALEPAYLERLIEREVLERRDDELWNEQVRIERQERNELAMLADNWNDREDDDDEGD